MMMGAEWEKKLKESFKEHGVKYKAKRAARVLSPEAKEALRERLTIARKAKADLSK
jgi:parvulin-like peptidyl-prolyl isomerase